MGLSSSATLMDTLTVPDVMPYWMTNADLSYYEAEFRRSGLFGPISRYRNHTRDFDFLSPFRGRTITQPACFIAGDKDPAFNGFGMVGDPIGKMRPAVPNLETAVVLPGCGHWTQQERPAEVNAALVPWLASLKGRAV
jgi:pimeloyl-ACP methyl ester carboxylesterase